VLPAVPAINLSPGSVTLHEGTDATIDIIDGWGEYKIESYDNTAITFDVDNLPTATGSTAHIGTVMVGALQQPGNTYPKLEDKYGQTATVGVQVHDTKLRLGYTKHDLWDGTEGLLLSWSNYEYVGISESYKGVKTLVTNNDTITAYVIYLRDTTAGTETQVIQVFPKKIGTSRITVEDHQGNVEEVYVRVGSLPVEELEEDPVDLTEDTLDYFLQLFYDEIPETTSTQNIDVQESTYILSESLKKRINSALNNRPYTSLSLLETKLSNVNVNEYSNSAKIQVVIDYFILSITERINGTRLHILETDYSSEVEDGYIWGYYFKVNNPDLISEVGIEYYNATSTSETNMLWWTIPLENEWDWEFGAFILPKTKYTLVRGYAIDTDGNKMYSWKSKGVIIESQVPLYEYYEISEILEPEGTSINSLGNIGTILVWIWFLWVWFYYEWECIEHILYNENFYDFSCPIW